MIPTVGAHVKVANLHPVFAARLGAFFADPRFHMDDGTPLLKVFSGARTHEQQKYLYDGFVAGRPGFALAADPDDPITPRYDVPSGRGSWHMEQVGTRYGAKGYAVDLNFDSFCWTYFGLEPVGANRAKVCAYIEAIAREYLLARTVPSEEWHYQMAYQDWTTVPQEDDMTDEQDRMLKDLHSWLKPGSEFRKRMDVVFEALDRDDYTDKARKDRIPTIRKLIKTGGKG